MGESENRGRLPSFPRNGGLCAAAPVTHHTTTKPHRRALGVERCALATATTPRAHCAPPCRCRIPSTLLSAVRHYQHHALHPRCHAARFCRTYPTAVARFTIRTIYSRGFLPPTAYAFAHPACLHCGATLRARGDTARSPWCLNRATRASLRAVTSVTPAFVEHRPPPRRGERQ